MVTKRFSKFGLFALVLFGIVCLLTPSHAESEGDGGFAPVEAGPADPAIPAPGLSPFLARKGRVAAAGIGMRGTGSGMISIGGIPTGARIKKAYLYWAVVDNPSPSSNAGVLDGIPITGVLIASGPSPCWPQEATHVYRANVKPIVLARADPNGDYALSGFPDSGDFYEAPSIEGATLVIVWKKRGYPKRLILINDGLEVLMYGGDKFYTDFIFEKKGRTFEAKAPVSADLTVMGGDGHSGTILTEFNGTTVATDSWDSSDGDLWDTDQFDVSTLVSAGDTQAQAAVGIPSGTGADCIAWTTAILEVKARRVR